MYDLNRPGSTKVERVVFAIAGASTRTARAPPSTCPPGLCVNVTIAADADIDSFVQESDIATVNMDRTFTKAGQQWSA